jgi:FG-GAP-like repeat
VNRALLPLLLALPLGCRGSFDLDKYVADAESGTMSSADTVEVTASTDASATTSEDSGTADDTTDDDADTETETGTDTDAECMVGLIDLGGACIGLRQMLLTTGSAPTDLEVADFNNDSWLDLVVPGSSVLYFGGSDPGMFGDQTPIIGAMGTALASVDWDANGFRDLLVISNESMRVFLSDGTTFSGTTPFMWGGYDAALADFDGDQLEDIVLTGNVVRGLQRVGDELVENYVAMYPTQGLAVANLDDNPSLDIAVAANATNQVIVVLPDAAWGPATELSIPFPLVADVAVGNIGPNNDVKLLAVGGQAGEVKLLTVLDMILEETGVFAVGDLPRAVATGDINGDGLTDVAVANASSHDVSVLLGERNFLTNEFRLPVDDPNDSPMSIEVADLDNDGRAEIIVGMANTNRVLVYGHIE